MKKGGEEDDWKKKTRDRGWWKRLTDEAVNKLRADPHPFQREKRKRDRYLNGGGRVGKDNDWKSWHRPGLCQVEKLWD